MTDNKYKQIVKHLSLDEVLGHMRAMTQRRRDDQQFEKHLIIRYEEIVTNEDQRSSSHTRSSRDTGQE